MMHKTVIGVIVIAAANNTILALLLVVLRPSSLPALFWVAMLLPWVIAGVMELGLWIEKKVGGNDA